MTHCSGGYAKVLLRILLIYRRKGQTSDPFLFVVPCCYNLSDNLRLCHSNLSESIYTKNLRGCLSVGRFFCWGVGMRRWKDGQGGALDWLLDLHSTAWIGKGLGNSFSHQLRPGLKPPQDLPLWWSAVIWGWEVSMWVGANRLASLEIRQLPYSLQDIWISEGTNMAMKQWSPDSEGVDVQEQCPRAGTKVMVLVNWSAFPVLLLCLLFGSRLEEDQTSPPTPPVLLQNLKLGRWDTFQEHTGFFTSRTFEVWGLEK